MQSEKKNQKNLQMEWLQPNGLSWNEEQWKGLKLAKVIPIEFPKSGKNGKQKDRQRDWRNEMLLNDERKFWKKQRNKKSEWDDTKCTEVAQTLPNWSSLKSQDFISFPAH